MLNIGALSIRRGLLGLQRSITLRELYSNSSDPYTRVGFGAAFERCVTHDWSCLEIGDSGLGFRVLVRMYGRLSFKPGAVG